MGYRLGTWHRVTLELTGDVRLGSIVAATRGLTSGGTVSAARWVWGGDLGAQVRWVPTT